MSTFAIFSGHGQFAPSRISRFLIGNSDHRLQHVVPIVLPKREAGAKISTSLSDEIFEDASSADINAVHTPLESCIIGKQVSGVLPVAFVDIISVSPLQLFDIARGDQSVGTLF